MSFYFKKYLWIFHVLSIVVAAYFLARMTTTVIAMEVQKNFALSPIRVPTVSLDGDKGNQVKKEAYQVIQDRNIFDSKATTVAITDPEKDPTEEVKEDTPPSDGKAVLTKLKIVLLSTLSVGDGKDKRSSCIIVPESKKTDQQVFTIGDPVPGASDTKIVTIHNHRVEFFNKKQLEYVEFVETIETASSSEEDEGKKPSKKEEAKKDDAEEASSGDGIQKTGDNKFVIPRSEIDKAIQSGNVLTQIAIVQDPKGRGFRIRTIAPGSVFTKLGLKTGDILRKANGNDITASVAMDLANQLSSLTQLSLEIERRGKTITYEYEIQ